MRKFSFEEYENWLDVGVRDRKRQEEVTTRRRSMLVVREGCTLLATSVYRLFRRRYV